MCNVVVWRSEVFGRLGGRSGESSELQVRYEIVDGEVCL